MKKIIVTGCLGYTGSVLTESLIKSNYKVLGIDTAWFGNNLKYSIKNNKNFEFLKRDIRDKNLKLPIADAVIHLAAVSNDPSTDLSPNLSWEIGCIGTKNLIEKSIKTKIAKFIYASSGSVYGIKKEKKVTENMVLDPISIYNKCKMTTERLLLSYKTKINLCVVRPATVCGYSPRIRYDVSVNALTIQALQNKIITVFGGNQIRPNIHIDDLIRLYIFLLKKRIKSGEILNAGFENISILKIAKMIQKKTKAKIIITKSNDPRSYRVDSTKLFKLGFKPKKKVETAIDELVNYYQKKIIPKMSPINFNVKWMKQKKII
jgi:nucleoside-diphosphate-sugar epimerase